MIGLLLVLVAWGSSGFGSDEPVSYLHVGIVAVFGCLSGYWVLKKANATTRDFCLRVFEITWAVVVVGTLGWQAVGAAQSTLDPKINAGWNQIQEHGRLVATTSKRLLAALETRSAATNSADLASLPDWLSETARADAVGAFVHSMPPSRINAALTEAERELLDSIRWNQRRQTVVLLEVQQQEAIRKKLVFGREWTIYLFALAAAAGLKLAKALFEARVSWVAITQAPAQRRRKLLMPLVRRRRNTDRDRRNQQLDRKSGQFKTSTVGGKSR